MWSADALKSPNQLLTLKVTLRVRFGAPLLPQRGALHVLKPTLDSKGILFQCNLRFQLYILISCADAPHVPNQSSPLKVHSSFASCGSSYALMSGADTPDVPQPTLNPKGALFPCSSGVQLVPSCLALTP